MKRLLIFIFAVVSTMPVMRAQSGSLTDIESRLRQTKSDIKVSEAQVENFRRDSRAIEQHLSALVSQNRSRTREIALLDEKIKMLGIQLDRNTDSLRLLESMLTKIKEEYAALVRISYINRLNNSELSLLFAAESYNSSVRREELIQLVNRYRQQRAGEIVQLSGEIGAFNERLRTQQEEIVQQRRDVEIERTRLTIDENRERALLAEMSARLRSSNSELSRQRRQQNVLEQKRDSIIHANLRITTPATTSTTVASSRSSAPASSSLGSIAVSADASITTRFDSSRGQLAYPVVGGTIGQRFSSRAIYVSHASQQINWTSFTCLSGSNVTAFFDGTVATVKQFNSGGYYIIIQHGAYKTAYQTLERVAVKPGDVVTTGQVIGATSSSENRSLWTLQFYLYRNTPIDPSPWFIRR